ITQISKTLLEGESWRGLIHLNNKKSSEQIYTVSINKFEAEGNQVYYIITYINNSKEVELEKQLRQAKKLETIGALTGGISHEFNNILTPIMGFAELITYDVDETSSIYDSAEQIIKSSMRAKDLISQILTFSRQKESQHKPVSLIPLVKEAIKLLRAAIPSNITIKANIQCKNDKIIGDPSQIYQLIMNLCTNSLNAMKDIGGEINLLITQSFINHNPHDWAEFKSGEYICIEISDTGKGMQDTIIEQANDQYFTIKDSEEVADLGLAVVFGIVKAMQGFVRVDSTLKNGTAFYIYLPIYYGEHIQTSNYMQIYIGNRQKILFIDDELPVLNVMARILDKLNYQATCFSESDKALQEYLNNQDEYDLIITDYYMPKMTGIDLIQELRSQSLNIPIVLSTGYSEYLTNESIEKYQITDYVSKPISIYDLSKKLYNIFNNRMLNEEV
ncbi:MAG TPA: response regulator, partial [Candidatus Cloacimonadota bacterium]|nr:response regulator [Candidatus Cloacimonadota bacterium]